MPEWNAQISQTLANTQRIGFGKPELLARIEAIDCDADADRFAMSDFIVAQRLQSMRRPVAEIERPRLEHLKGISPLGNVSKMPDTRTVNRTLANIGFSSIDLLGVATKPIKIVTALEQRNLHRFTEPAAKVAVGKCRQQF